MTEVIVMMPCCGGPIYFPSDVEQISEHVYRTAHPEKVRRIHAEDCNEVHEA